ncbi:hypothetical protein ACHAPJ_007600 [Fusarium lateritium]
MSLPGLDESVPPTVHVETMNPARAQMLSEVAQEESTRPTPAVKVEDILPVAPPLITGANLAPVGDASLRALRGSQAPRAMSISGQGGSLLSLRDPNVPSSMVSVKRPISSVAGEVRGNRGKKQKISTYYTEIQSLGHAPVPDANTRYLTSLLRNRTLTLCLQPVPKRSADSAKPKTYNFRISQAGLIQHENLSTFGYTRALPLSLHDQDISGTEGAITRTVVGELLEDVWPRLNNSEKYQYARQLRNILHKMRAPGKVGGGSAFGSIQSGPYSLMQDKHPDHTYYAIRTRPDQKQFMALLMSTLYETVPKQVAQALVSRFRTDYKVVLTHGALCPKNIIISNHMIVWILGWDCAGDYPAWWEYVRFFEARTTDTNRDWYDYAADIFEEEFPVELAAYQGIARCQQP